MTAPLLVLVKHSQPTLDARLPPREWRLSPAGEADAARLAERLRSFLPFRLHTSSEPKATRTCEIVSEALGLPFNVVDALREIDRRAGALLEKQEYWRLNQALFESPNRAVAGAESANAALSRFAAAVLALTTAVEENVVVITHGTVISLFVAAHNSVDPFALWKELGCGDVVVLRARGYRLVRGPS